MKFGYQNGFEAGRKITTDFYESQLATLVEQMALLRERLTAESARADNAIDQLMLRVGSRAITARGEANEEKKIEQRVRSMQEMLASGDPTADRPLGTVGSEFDQPNDPRADLLHGLDNLQQE